MSLHSKAQKLSYKTLFLLIIFLLIPIVLLLRIGQRAHLVSAGWWNDSWGYRQAINISTHTVGETNVYIITSVNIGTTTKAQADDGDFRFTTVSGQLLDYYISADTGTTAPTFHINFDSFPSGAQTIYAYYGNPSATNGFVSADFSTQASNYSLGTPSTEEISKAPIAYWSFDEGVGTTTYDSSSNKLNGLITNAVWKSEDNCISGTCLYYDGTGDYVNFGNPDKLKVERNNFTVETWVKLNETRCGVEIIHKGSNIICGSIYYGGWSLGFNNNDALFIASDVGTSKIAVPRKTNAFVANTWMHLVGVKNGDTYSLYFNGQLASSVTNAGLTITDTSNLKVGGNTTAWNTHGFIDETKIYPYARTAAEIKSDYNAGKAHAVSNKGSSVNLGSNQKNSEAFSDGLVGYWKMDENIGTTTLDSSGNNNTGTFGTGDSAPSWSTGMYGVGPSFDGNDYISIGTTANLMMTDYVTVSAWIKPNTLNHQGPIISRGVRSPWWLGQWSSDKLHIALTWSDDSYADYHYGVLSTGTWQHVAFTFNYQTGQTVIYKNGEIVSTQSKNPGMLLKTTTTGIKFGGVSSSYGYWDGLIDEVRIYNRTLQPSEISQLYNYTPGPYTYLTFDEGVGTTIFDKSGNNYSASWAGTGTHWTSGKFGKAANFNGTSDVITFATLPKPASMPLTIMFWAKPNSATPVGMFDSAPGTGDVLRNYNTGSVEWWSGAPSVSLGLTANQWTHLTFIYSFTGGTQTITYYKNGTLQSTTNGNGDGAFAWTTFRLGNINGGSAGWYSGSLDEFKVYNYARTPKQIVSDMNASHPAVGSPIASALAHYEFNEGFGTSVNNSGSVGSTLNGTFGTGNSAPTWTNDGKYGKALSFDGNDFIYNSSFSTPNSITVTAWINHNLDSGYKWVLGKEGAFTIGIGPSIFYGYVHDGTTGGSDNNGWNNCSATSPSIPKNGWHYIALTYDNRSQKIFLDGNLSKSCSFSPTGDSDGSTDTGSGNLTIGNLGTRAGTLFSGLIDDVKIYNYALTDNEVKTDYNQGKSLVMGSLSSGTGNTAPSTAGSQEYCVPGDTATCSPPVARWDFNEGTGTTAYDTSGNGNNGTLGTGNSSPVWTNGKNGKALSFDGSNDYVDTGTGPTLNFGTNDFTVESWIKTSTANYNKIISKWLDNNNRWYIHVTNTGVIYFYGKIGSTDVGGAAGNTNVADNRWHHITISTNKASNLSYIYIDGKLDATGTASTNWDNSGTLQIGSYLGIGNFNGLIDQVRIYNYARSPAQVALDYNQGKPIAYWNFDECQGSTINDSSGNNLTGTLSIGASGTQNSVGTCSVGTSAAWTNGATGKINSSLNFDGNDDFINIGSQSVLNNLSADISVSTWVKTSLNSGVQTIIGRGNDWHIEKVDTAYKFEHRNASNTIVTPSGTNTSVEWIHVVGTYSTAVGTVNLYLNGILVDSKAQTGVTRVGQTQNQIGNNYAWHAGGTYNDFFWNGQIDDVQIFNYALTATQVKTLYSGGAVNFK